MTVFRICRHVQYIAQRHKSLLTAGGVQFIVTDSGTLHDNILNGVLKNKTGKVKESIWERLQKQIRNNYLNKKLRETPEFGIYS